MNTFEKFHRELVPEIEESLLFYLNSLKIEPILFETMKYSLIAGGKRLRPFLAVAVAELLKKEREIVMPYAAAVEFIHTYSLIHDDLPALDNDDLRRGKPSNHKVFGVDMAILAGDALSTDAFSLLFEFGKGNIQKGGSYLAKAAGSRGMVLGQVKDCKISHYERDVEILNGINRYKTASLIAASTAGVAAWLDAKEIEIESLENYGINLGLAFQITDDILDITADSSEFGKKTGSDAALNKKTYPTLLGIEKAFDLAAEHANIAANSLGIFENSTWKTALTELAEYVLRRKK
ncbi:MAG: polyprenyl synthetase family protein [bacterium]